MRELKSGTATTNRKSSDDDDDDYDDDSPAPEANYGNGSAANGRKSPKNRYNYVQSMRHTNQEKSLAAKKRVIKMLFMVVLEFFVCWTPLYVVQTWMVFDYDSAGRHLTSVSLNFVQLLSYVSSCCNPITYCFMNKKFRQGFISAFRCCCGGRKGNILRKASDFSYGPSQRTGNNKLTCTGGKKCLLTAAAAAAAAKKSSRTPPIGRIYKLKGSSSAPVNKNQHYQNYDSASNIPRR